MVLSRAFRSTVVVVLSIILAAGAAVSMAAPPGAPGGTPLEQGNPTVLLYGETVDGTLNSAQPRATFLFDAALGDVVTITMIVTSGDLDPFLALQDSAGGPLITDDNSGGGLNARLTYILPADGQYTIVATHSGGDPSASGGTYSLNLTAAVGDQSGQVPTAVPAADSVASQGDVVRFSALTAGATVRDTLSQDVGMRLYWFEGQTGDQIALSPEQFADFQPLIVLYDREFSELVRAEPGTGLRLSLPDSGLYFAAVVLPHTGSLGGAYGFSFSLSENPARVGSFTSILYGETAQGSLDDAVPGITYQFQGAAGDTVSVVMRRAGGDLNSYLYLLDADGQLLFEDNDSGGSGGDAQVNYTLPQDGEYLILATRLGQGQGTTSGSFVLDLRADAVGVVVELPPSEAPTLPADYEGLTQITYGDTVEGEISDTKDMDVYVFLGTEGDTIQLEMTSQNSGEYNGLDPLLILLDAERIPLLENDDIVDGQVRDSRIDFTLPSTGYYAVVATRFDQSEGTTAGAYVLTLSGPDQLAESDLAEMPVPEMGKLASLKAQTLVAGVPAQDTFSTMGRLYTFSAGAGSLIDLAVTTDPGLEAVVILANSELTEVSSSETGSLTGITLDKAGTYLAILMPRLGPVNEVVGGYILALTASSDAVPVDEAEPDETAPVVASGPRAITLGDTVTGLVDDDNVSQIFTFQGVAGDQVRITMQAAAGSPLDAYLELQDQNGVTVASNDDIDPGVIRDAQIEAELPADGEYTIIASRYVGDDAPVTSGEFSLTLERFEVPVAPTGISSDVTSIVYGGQEMGEITDEQYLVFYVFVGTAGDSVSIDVDTISGNLDSVAYLYQSVGDGWIEIANNDDSPTGGTYDPLLDKIVLPQTGKYLIAVGRYGLERETSFGTFTISLTRN